MRERLTVAFVAITLLLLLGAGAVRSYAIDGQLREHENEAVNAQAKTISIVLGDLVDDGGRIDQDSLQRFAVDDTRITYEAPGVQRLVVTGDGYRAEAEPVVSTVLTEDGTLTVSRTRDSDVGALWGSNRLATLAVFVLLAIVAGAAGYFVARALSEPFRQLAAAAAALGRGRFDLDLPETKVPEALAIAQALDSSAGQLRDRLEREREFGLHTSHVLRTPLTSLRLHLEELVGDPNLSEESREAALDCLKAVGTLNQVAGELVEIGGRGVLVEGAAMPLRDLATQLAQRWADVLDQRDRGFTAAVEGDIELKFTPGPVEQVLDVVLEDVVEHETGDVRLVFEGAASRLTIDVFCSGPGRAPSAAPVLDRVHGVLAALGGRVEAVPDRSSVRVHLPRR